MAKEKEAAYEGHGENEAKPTVSKGTFIGVGTYTPLKDSPISVNKKTGGDEANTGR